jgi:hypothetical protein
MVDKLLCSFSSSLGHFYELFTSSILREKLGWDRVRKDYEPGWEEKLGSWNYNEE